MRDVRNYFLMMRFYKMGNYSSDIKDSQDSKTIPGTHYSARLMEENNYLFSLSNGVSSWIGGSDKAERGVFR